jgi:type I restriction enzyme S subunit
MDVPRGWKWTSLSSIARLESGHTPSRKVPEYWGGDVPWIGIRDATENHGRVIYCTAENTNALGIHNSSARILPENTVCLSRTASVGYVIVMGRPMATSQDFVNWVCSEAINPHFLKYILLAERDALLSFAVGSVHATIYFPEVKAFHVCIPPRPEQDAIVDVLLRLDEKIELNRRMNETLEAMAQAIFRDWFVDFGPTRAKMAGVAPYLAPELWDLFPACMGLDAIPEAWRNSPIEQSFDVTMGQSPPGETYNEDGDGLPFFQGRRDFAWRFPKRRVFCRAPTRIAHQDDTLVSVRAPVGDLNMAWESCCIGRGVAAVRHKTGSRGYTYYALQALQPQLAAFEHTGTVFGAINKKQFDNLSFVAPPGHLVEEFEKCVRPMDDRIRSNADEIATLAQIRDLLLPKLISGEIRLRNAECALEDAA